MADKNAMKNKSAMRNKSKVKNKDIAKNKAAGKKKYAVDKTMKQEAEKRTAGKMGKKKYAVDKTVKQEAEKRTIGKMEKKYAVTKAFKEKTDHGKSVKEKRTQTCASMQKNVVAAIIRDFPMKNSSKKSRNMLEKMSENSAKYCRSSGWSILIITATKCMQYLTLQKADLSFPAYTKQGHTML